jgi:hypothetical protein
MATVIISQLPPPPNGTGSGSSKGTDLFPATDTTDTSSAASGTTKKYTLSEINNFLLGAQGLTTYAATRVATVSALTATYANGVLGVGATLTNATTQAALTIDGVALSIADRVLVKNQASTFQNGIYTVTTVGTGATNWVLTRATDYDQAADVVQYGVVMSNQGTVNAGKLWQETGAGPWTMGTTPIIFAAYTSQSLAIPVTLAQGGTSAALTANNGGIFYSTATAGAILAGTATAGQMLQSGATAAPAWSTATYPSIATGTGTILRANGTNWVASTSTFADTYGVNTLLYAASANAVSGLATTNSAALVTNGSGVPAWQAMAAGQILIGTTAGAPVAAAINSGTGIVVANGSGSITVNATGGGLATATIAGTTQAAAVNTTYIALNSGQTTLTLPAVYAVGEIVRLVGATANTGGWVVTASAGDTVRVNNSTTSAGGTVTCAAVAGQCIEIICDVANSSWIMTSTSSVLLTTA